MAVSWARLARRFTPRFRLRTLFVLVGLIAIGLWAKVELPGWQRWWQIRQARGRISQYERMVAGDGDPAKAPPELVAILGDSRLQHWGVVHHVATGPEERLMSFGSDNRFRTWDVATGDQIALMPAKCFACSVDGCRAFLVNDQNEVLVWDVAAGEVSRRLRSENAKAFRCLAANLDGTLIAALGGDFDAAEVTVWRVTPEEVLGTWNVPGSRVEDLSLSRDGKLLATINELHADIWNVATQQRAGLVHGVSGNEKARLCKVVFSSDGTHVFTGDATGKVKRWKLDSGDAVELEHSNNSVRDMSLDHEGRWLCVVMGSNIAEFALDEDSKSGWRLNDRHFLSRPEPVSCSREKKLQAFGHGGYPLTLWRNGKPVQLSRSLDTDVACLAFTPDGKYLITGGRNGELALWHSGSWTLYKSWHAHAAFVKHVAASPAGRVFASISEDRTLAVWDIATQQQVAEIPSLYGWPWPAFTADGQGILVGLMGRTDIAIYDAATGQITTVLSSAGSVHNRGQIAPTPDGKLLVAGASFATLAIWDVAEGAAVRKIGPVTGAEVPVAVSPDSASAVASFQGRGLAAWDIASGDERWKLPKAHAALVQSVAISPSGRLIASAANDGVVRLWSTQDGSLVHEIPLCPPNGVVRQVVFSPDGTYLATANGNGTAYVLDVKAIKSSTRD